jgi:hypothetical protein
MSQPGTASANEGVAAWLRLLEDQRLWGTVSLKYEGGRVVHVRREENFKPNELSGKPRSHESPNQ